MKIDWLKKYLAINLFIVFYSVNIFGATFEKYENYNPLIRIFYENYCFSRSPHFLGNFVLPGTQLSDSNSLTGLYINEANLIEHKQFLQLINTIEINLAKFIINNKRQLDQQIKDTRNEGSQVLLKDSELNREYISFVNPELPNNYRNAGQYLFEKLLLTPPAENLKNTIIHAHKQIIHGLMKDGDVLKPGYRVKEMFLLPVNDKLQLAAKYFYEFMLNKFSKKFIPEKDIDKYIPKFTADDLKDLTNNGIHICPLFSKIPQLMDNFYNEFINGIKKVNDHQLTPVAFAAWAHMEIVKIHAFSDGNGRLARSMANAILMHWLYPPIIIKNDEEYMNAVSKDIQNPGYFSKYLAKAIEWTAKQIDNPNVALIKDGEITQCTTKQYRSDCVLDHSDEPETIHGGIECHCPYCQILTTGNETNNTIVSSLDIDKNN